MTKLTKQLWALWTRVRVEQDGVIDGLIASKGVQAYRPGMDTVDWQKVNRAGAKRWQEQLQAQRRTLKPDVREFPRRVNDR